MKTKAQLTVELEAMKVKDQICLASYSDGNIVCVRSTEEYFDVVRVPCDEDETPVSFMGGYRHKDIDKLLKESIN